jgi:hypothetical protein
MNTKVPLRTQGRSQVCLRPGHRQAVSARGTYPATGRQHSAQPAPGTPQPPDFFPANRSFSSPPVRPDLRTDEDGLYPLVVCRDSRCANPSEYAFEQIV